MTFTAERSRHTTATPPPHRGQRDDGLGGGALPQPASSDVSALRACENCFLCVPTQPHASCCWEVVLCEHPGVPRHHCSRGLVIVCVSLPLDRDTPQVAKERAEELKIAEELEGEFCTESVALFSQATARTRVQLHLTLGAPRDGRACRCHCAWQARVCVTSPP